MPGLASRKPALSDKRPQTSGSWTNTSPGAPSFGSSSPGTPGCQDPGNPTPETTEPPETSQTPEPPESPKVDVIGCQIPAAETSQRCYRPYILFSRNVATGDDSCFVDECTHHKTIATGDSTTTTSVTRCFPLSEKMSSHRAAGMSKARAGGSRMLGSSRA